MRRYTLARWKINLLILCFGQFMVMAGMTMIIPFLPLYIQELGITEPKQVALWAGAIFAANFVTSFFFQPLWGKLSDRYGRKMMLLRSGFGMSVVILLMGFATNAWQLLLLRMLNGTISGFMPASVSLLSVSAPKEKMGFAMGTLQSGGVAGSILGPFIGGLMAEWLGFRPIFYITGALLFGASFLALLFIREKFDAVKASKEPNISILKGFEQLKQIRQLPSLFAVTFMIQFAMLSSMPLIPLFVQEIHGNGQYLAFFAGLVTSVTGFSNMAAAPLLGRLSDKLGPERILIISLIGAAILFIPQAFVHSIWQLLTARFFLGIFIGGLLPSVNALIRKFTPDGMESRSYSFNTSFQALGNMLGPVIGGLLSGWVTIRGIFILTTVMLIINAVWVNKSLIRTQKLKNSKASP